MGNTANSRRKMEDGNESLSNMIQLLENKVEGFIAAAKLSHNIEGNENAVVGGKTLSRVSDIRVATDSVIEVQIMNAVGDFFMLAQGGDAGKYAAVKGASKLVKASISAMFGVSKGQGMQKHGFFVLYMNFTFVRVDYQIYTYCASGTGWGTQESESGACYVCDITILDPATDIKPSEIDFLIGKALYAGSNDEFQRMLELKIQLTESAILSRLLTNPNIGFKDLEDITVGLKVINEKIRNTYEQMKDFDPVKYSIPDPKYFTDFSDTNNVNNTPFTLNMGAEIKDGAPGNVGKALRIDRDGPFATLPSVDISPDVMPECTLCITFFLESIPEGSRGWLLNHDNGGFDRCLALHDERFNGIGHGVGYPAGPVYNKYTTPPTGKWVQMVLTYRQGGECAVFVSNDKAPITHIGKNNKGKTDLIIGRVDFAPNHWCDCWVKDVGVYDIGLSDEQVNKMFEKFEVEVLQRAPRPLMRLPRSL